MPEIPILGIPAQDLPLNIAYEGPTYGGGGTLAGGFKVSDRGELTLFPGVSAPYEEPAKPDLVLATDKLAVEECVEQILRLLEERGILG